MARPSRCRRICAEPTYVHFAPCGISDRSSVQLMVDEFEVIRLVDYEHHTHEECAALMGVSRTTVSEICERARHKLADCLVNGKSLQIAGGNYRLCDGSLQSRCGRLCQKSVQQTKGVFPVNIAVPYENGQIFQHFGHTTAFKLYHVQDGTIQSSEVRPTEGSGHGALAGLLQSWQVDTILCGGIGAGAQDALARANIQLYGGVSGNADDAVQALLNGTLQYSADPHCDHPHDHSHGGQCGHHGCHN